QLDGQAAEVPLQRYCWHDGEPLLPAPEIVQVPAVAVLHASQAPLQAVLQQTPSTQKPLVHCELLQQAVPLLASASAQWPLLHTKPAAHCAFDEQPDGQLALVPPQR